MTCEPDRIGAFLADELAPDEASLVDVHLVSCETCWQAVTESRTGRGAAALLRETPPEALEDRIRLAITLAGGTRARRRNPRTAMLAVAVIAMLAVGAVAVLHRPDAPLNAEAAIAKVLNANDPIAVEHYAVDRTDIVVARRAAGVPMPVDGGMRSLPGAAWVVERGGVTIVCTARTGAILAGRASPATLLAVAVQLRLA